LLLWFVFSVKGKVLLVFLLEGIYLKSNRIFIPLSTFENSSISFFISFHLICTPGSPLLEKESYTLMFALIKNFFNPFFLIVLPSGKQF
jgi:hypothetical protein